MSDKQTLYRLDMKKYTEWSGRYVGMFDLDGLLFRIEGTTNEGLTEIRGLDGTHLIVPPNLLNRFMPPSNPDAPFNPPDAALPPYPDEPT